MWVSRGSRTVPGQHHAPVLISADDCVDPPEAVRVLQGLIVQDLFDFGKQLQSLGVCRDFKLMLVQSVHIVQNFISDGGCEQGSQYFYIRFFSIHFSVSFITLVFTGNNYGIIHILIPYTALVNINCRCSI